jgi:hypothetical protein
MFDVCELIVHALSPRSGLLARQSAFGEAAHELVLDGVHFAVQYVAPSRRITIGPRVRVVDGWSALSLRGSISEAAEHDDTWGAYLELLDRLLRLHDDWIFHVEADCDQHPLCHEEMTTEGLLACLDRQRRDRDGRFALVAARLP